MNLYQYVGNNPASYTDPFGLMPGCETFLECLREFAAMQLRGFAAGADPTRTGLADDEGRFGALLGRLSLAAGTSGTPSRLLSSGAGAASASTTLGTFELTPTHGAARSGRALSNLVDDISANGIREPIKYVEHNGARYVVDGHHRLRAAKELGMTRVPVEEVSLPFRGYRTASDLFGGPY
jgi:hypothetical protein